MVKNQWRKWNTKTSGISLDHILGVIGTTLIYSTSHTWQIMDLDGWVDGRVTSPRIGSMDSVQVGKAVFVKVSFASLGFEPRTFSYPGSCATNTLLAKKLFSHAQHLYNGLWSESYHLGETHWSKSWVIIAPSWQSAIWCNMRQYEAIWGNMRQTVFTQFTTCDSSTCDP